MQPWHLVSSVPVGTLFMRSSFALHVALENAHHLPPVGREACKQTCTSNHIRAHLTPGAHQPAHQHLRGPSPNCPRLSSVLNTGRGSYHPHPEPRAKKSLLQWLASRECLFFSPVGPVRGHLARELFASQAGSLERGWEREGRYHTHCALPQPDKRSLSPQVSRGIPRI